MIDKINTSSYIEMGRAFLKNKEYSKAIEFFQAAIESLESVKEANLGLAEAYFAIQKMSKGRLHYSRPWR